MSVGEVLSPMSVDKSLLQLTKPVEPPRNDRERFYNIEEYQLDIVDYLREAEVSV